MYSRWIIPYIYGTKYAKTVLKTSNKCVKDWFLHSFLIKIITDINFNRTKNLIYTLFPTSKNIHFATFMKNITENYWK